MMTKFLCRSSNGVHVYTESGDSRERFNHTIVSESGNEYVSHGYADKLDLGDKLNALLILFENPNFKACASLKQQGAMLDLIKMVATENKLEQVT